MRTGSDLANPEPSIKEPDKHKPEYLIILGLFVISYIIFYLIGTGLQ